jgi:hypothetical protein
VAAEQSSSYDSEHFSGRDEELRVLREAILDCERIVVYGLAGIGKSTLVEAARASVEGQLGGNHYVDCALHDNVDKIVAELGRDLSELEAQDLPSSKSEPDVLRRAVVETLNARTKRSLVVLDNLEVVWWADDIAARSLLTDLGSGAHVALAVAIRAAKPPDDLARKRGWLPVEAGALDDEAAVKVFLSWAPRFKPDGQEPAQGEAEQEIRKLLRDKLQGVPLAIVLLARRAAADEETTIDQLGEHVGGILSRLPLQPARGRWRSLDACLKLSLDHLRPPEERPALRLLTLLGVLPAGIRAEDAKALDAKLSFDFDKAKLRLTALGLAFEHGDRLDTLKPIRDYLEHTIWPASSDLALTREHYLGLVAQSREADKTDRRVLARVAAESANVASMAATLHDRGEECDALLEQGDVELRADEYTLALDSFRKAGDIARKARDSRRLAFAALGASGGWRGAGHSFDRADEERLALLREAGHLLAECGDDWGDRDESEAALLPDDWPTLYLRVVMRLLAELHFDASEAATHERSELEGIAGDLAGRVSDPRISRDLALQTQKNTGPLAGATSSIEERLRDVKRLVEDASSLPQSDAADVKAEAEARLLFANTLLVAAQPEPAGRQLAAASELISNIPDKGDRKKLRFQQEVMRRSERHFAGELDAVRGELEDPPGDDRTDSPYRRWLNQSVLLALDTTEPESWAANRDWVELVRELKDELLVTERRKFGLPETANVDAELAYCWWPTWRATHALLLATRGAAGDSEQAHRLIYELSATNSDKAEGSDTDLEARRFGKILQHEYYVQVLALLALAVQRLTVLEARTAAGPSRWTDERVRWAKALNKRLEPFAGERVAGELVDGELVVPGSGVMNLGSVHSFRALLYGCAGEWGAFKTGQHFERGLALNRELGGRAAAVRTQVAYAELYRLKGPEEAREIAEEARREARELGMAPWLTRAEALL